MPVPHPAEIYLRDEGVVAIYSEKRAAILGCLGCKWLTAWAAGQPMSANTADIVRCTRLIPTNVKRTTRQLARAGILRIESPFGNGQESHCIATNSTLANGLLQRLTVPNPCMLEAIPKSDAPAMTRALLSQAVALREQRQMTQEYMAGCIGESQGGVSRFELGTQRVLLDTFVAYLETCGMGLAIVPLPDDSNQV